MNSDTSGLLKVILPYRVFAVYLGKNTCSLGSGANTAYT